MVMRMQEVFHIRNSVVIAELTVRKDGLVTDLPHILCIDLPHDRTSPFGLFWRQIEFATITILKHTESVADLHTNVIILRRPICQGRISVTSLLCDANESVLTLTHNLVTIPVRTQIGCSASAKK